MFWNGKQPKLKRDCTQDADLSVANFHPTFEQIIEFEKMLIKI